jgi:hypothetical protein
MKLINTTTISNEKIREVIRFVRPPGIRKFNVKVTNRRHWHLGGHADVAGNGVLLRVADQQPIYTSKLNGAVVKQVMMYPRIHRMYQIGQLKGRRYYIADRIECLVYLAAHELRHLWQTKHRRGRPWGSRGVYSEIDADSYAIRKLRAWRRR